MTPQLTLGHSFWQNAWFPIIKGNVTHTDILLFSFYIHFVLPCVLLKLLDGLGLVELSLK